MPKPPKKSDFNFLDSSSFWKNERAKKEAIEKEETRRKAEAHNARKVTDSKLIQLLEKKHLFHGRISHRRIAGELFQFKKIVGGKFAGCIGTYLVKPIKYSLQPEYIPKIAYKRISKGNWVVVEGFDKREK